jgi:hypothetical protein
VKVVEVHRRRAFEHGEVGRGAATHGNRAQADLGPVRGEGDAPIVQLSGVPHGLGRLVVRGSQTWLSTRGVVWTIVSPSK